MADNDEGWDIFAEIEDFALARLRTYVEDGGPDSRANEYNCTRAENAAEVIENLGLHLQPLSEGWDPLLTEIRDSLKRVKYKKGHPWGESAKGLLKMVNKILSNPLRKP